MDETPRSPEQMKSDERWAITVLTLKLGLFLLLPMISAALVAWIVLG